MKTIIAILAFTAFLAVNAMDAVGEISIAQNTERSALLEQL